MDRKLTITLSDDVYHALLRKADQGTLSQFIERLIRPSVVDGTDLVAGYSAMASDAEREQEAREWIE